jgi:hypothetical protein
MASIKKPHLVEVLEKDFHLVHNKIEKAKDNYLANHEKEYKQAKRAVEATRKNLLLPKNRLPGQPRQRRNLAPKQLMTS